VSEVHVSESIVAQASLSVSWQARMRAPQYLPNKMLRKASSLESRTLPHGPKCLKSCETDDEGQVTQNEKPF